ncbi:hypothetical protein [Rhodococcoides fascians]|uniref:hypothetical protein n=1 Tax=Rhodococcoides fascians TaxID=1828 RepID=UPI0037AE5B61
MGGGEIALIGFLGTLITAVGAYFAARLTSRAQQESNANDRWQGAFEAHDKVLKQVTDRLSTAESKIDSLEEDVDRERRRFRVAVDFIRSLLRWINAHPDLSHGAPAAPDDLIDELW